MSQLKIQEPLKERSVESQYPLPGKPDETAEETAYHLEAPEGLKAEREKAKEREARVQDLHLRTVEEWRLMDPQVDPWVEAEARVNPPRKADPKELNDHCPTKGLDPRMALGRWKVKLRISPKGAEMRGAELESRQTVCLEKIRTELASSLEEVQ